MFTDSQQIIWCLGLSVKCYNSCIGDFEKPLSVNELLLCLFVYLFVSKL